MKTVTTTTILIIFIIVIVVMIVVSIITTHDSKGITEDKPADYKLNVKELYKAYNPNEIPGELKYTNKILVVTGFFKRLSLHSNINVTLISLDEKSIIFCNFKKNETNIKLLEHLKKFDKVTIRGLYKRDPCCSTFSLTYCTLVTSEKGEANADSL